MSSILLKNANLISPVGRIDFRSILISDGIFENLNAPAISTEAEIDLNGATLLPGFIDIHIHGAVGIDVNDATVEGLLQIARFLAKNGVSAWVPTLVPDSDENYRKAIDVIDKLMEIQGDQPVAQALGVHYEGVFANEAMCGALRPKHFKKFTGNHPVRSAATPPKTGGELFGLPRLKTGVHLTTLAPEIEGGIELIREFVHQGWICLIGHTKANTEILDRAFEAGATHVTHFYNAMTGMHHRDVGVVGWALVNDSISFDIIADGIHVHPKMLEFACRSKTPDKVLLISDSISPAGFGDGEFEVWGEKISVKNGETRNARGNIAGSVITMLEAANRMLSLGFSKAEVSRMAALNPAKLLGIQKTHGSIEAGKRADLVAIENDGNVKLVMIGGRIVQTPARSKGEILT